MVGHKMGLQARVRTLAPNLKWTHCCIHREALVAKKCLTCCRRLLMKLQKTLNEVVQIINDIETRPLQSSYFLCFAKTWVVTMNSFSFIQSTMPLSRSRLDKVFWAQRWGPHLSSWHQVCKFSHRPFLAMHNSVLNWYFWTFKYFKLKFTRQQRRHVQNWKQG